MWNELKGITVLFTVFISSTISDDSCTVIQFPIGNRLTQILESYSWEEKFWFKPKSDFERMEIHLKVNNVLTIGPSFYLKKHIVIGFNRILNSSYFSDPYWIPLKIRVFEKMVILGTDKLVLRASVNKTFFYEIDDSLWWSQYKYQKYKILAKGGLSFSRCNPSPFITEGSIEPNSKPINETETIPKPKTTIVTKATIKPKTTIVTKTTIKPKTAIVTEITTKRETTSDNPLSKNNFTRAEKGDDEDENNEKTLADILKEDRKFSLIVLLITASLLTILLISAVCFVIFRKKMILKNRSDLQKKENESGESIYDSISTGRYFSPEENKSRPLPPPPYSSMYPSLQYSENRQELERSQENNYEIPKNSYSSENEENQYLEMTKSK